MTSSADRLSAIDTLGLVDGPPDAVFERTARLASALLGTSIVHTTLVLEDRQFYPSHVGLPEPVASARGTDLSYSFCKLVVEAEAPLVFGDTLEHEVLDDNRAVSEFGVRTYAGVPLRAADGTVVGTLCGLDFSPREWSPEEVRALGDLAASLHTELRLRREVDRLRDSVQVGLGVGLVAEALRGEAARLSPGTAADVRAGVTALAERLGGLARRLEQD